MPVVCHRCQGELPESAAGRPGDVSAELPLYCMHCAAPQLHLPEHLRVPVENAAVSTGAQPPPRAAARPAGLVDWHTALPGGLLVAGVGALLAVAGLRVPAASFLSTLWVVGGAVLSTGLYARRRPDASLNMAVGLRIGMMTGLLLAAAIAAGMALSGVYARFALHGMQTFDAQLAQQMELTRQQLVERMRQGAGGGQDAAFESHMLGFLRSDEMRGGLSLAYAATMAVLIVLFSLAGGAFAGLMHRLRQTAARRGA